MHIRRPLQSALFLILISVLVSLSALTVQSSPQMSQSVSQNVSGGAPALQAPGTPYVYYFPVIASQGTDLTISQVRVIQGATPSGSYATYIADRPTTVRVFVSVSDGSSVPGVTARMYGFDNSGNPLGSLNAGPITAPSDESLMTRTLNFSLPANWLKPSYSYYIDLNPDGTVTEDRANDRYPTSGRAPFNFVTAQPLNVVIVPVMYLPYGATDPTFPAGYYSGDFSYLTSLPFKVFPVPSINYAVHPLFSYEPSSASYNLNDSFGDGWFYLLQQITALHNSEDPYPYDTVYYGVVNYIDAHGCAGGCTIGMGWIGVGYDGGWYGATSVGWTGSANGAGDATNTLTHETGHNFGREHVACSGQEDRPDLEYPYPGGSIGGWGLDVATGALKNPALYRDYMSYCEPYVWTSDYTYAGIKSYRDAAGFDKALAAQRTASALYVSGIIAPDGTVALQPVYQQTASVNVPPKGTHTLELLGDKGRVIAAYPFTPRQIADSKGASGFGFFVPAVDGLEGLRVKAGNQTVKEKTVPAAMAAANFGRQPLAAQRQARGTVLRWTPVEHPSEQVVYRIRLSRDGGTSWQVLALDWRSAEFTVPQGLDVANATIEVQASDGIHTATQTFTVGSVP